MKWASLGRLFEAKGQKPWTVSHSQTPWREGEKIYFSSRDRSMRSHITHMIWKTGKLSERPDLTPGSPGHFDDRGVSLACIVEDFVYYIGWNITAKAPFQNRIGLCIRTDNRWEKFSKKPILGFSHIDPHHLSYPFVLKENGVFRMWYGSSLRWEKDLNAMEHVIKYAESSDGIHWNPHGRVCIGLSSPEEIAITKPHVIKEDNGYHMWYSSKKKSSAYGIGYAFSTDGLGWTRLDECMAFSTPNSHWDSQCKCYPHIFFDAGKALMLYCGDVFGKAGFGLAILEGGACPRSQSFPVPAPGTQL